MLFKLPIIAALFAAGTTLASPAPEPVAAPEVAEAFAASANVAAPAELFARQSSCTPNGQLLLYKEQNYGQSSAGPLFLAPYKGQPGGFCTLFTPNVQAPYFFQSYIANDVIAQFFLSTDCSGNAAILINSTQKLTKNPKVVAQALRSFQIIYS